MKNIFKSLIICTVLALLTVGSSNVWAGNRDRSGQSGASHLLIDHGHDPTVWPMPA